MAALALKKAKSITLGVRTLNSTFQWHIKNNIPAELNKR